MKRLLATLVVLIVGTGTFGCSMCCGPYDFHYPAYGGKHERVDPTYGRVGSVFSDPNAGYYGESADSNLVAHPEIRSLDPELNDDIDDMETIEPRGSSEDNGPSVLPQPDDTDPTASRLWKRKPLRSQFQWR